MDGGAIDDFLTHPPTDPLFKPHAPFYTNNRWYLPVLQPEYDITHDNLIILDMTGERALPMMLDELSLLGSRIPRLVVITQKKRIREIEEKNLFSFPISNLVVVSLPQDEPIADMHLPLVLNAIGVALAAVWKETPVE